MLARLQQLSTLLILAAAAAWAAWAWQAGHRWGAPLGAWVIAFSYALFMAVEYLFVWRVNQGDPAPKASVGQMARAWWGEVKTAPRVFAWWQPFCANREPDFVPLARERRGVVLVHGFICNRGLWNGWMPRLRHLGIPFVAVSLEPVFGSISDYAPRIDAAVQQLTQATGQAPVIVGHSMGGLAIRAWLAAFQGGERVHRIVTVGTPHRGTWMGRFGVAPNTREMRLGTPWQRTLEAGERPDLLARFTCFYGHCDNIVFPASTATLPGADNRHLSAVAHVAMLDAPAVFDTVVTLTRQA